MCPQVSFNFAANLPDKHAFSPFEYIKARLKVFHEEELDVQLVLFNDVLDHVLRIDRVFRQIQGHLLLIGVSGSGKVTVFVIAEACQMCN